jgi:predicted small lipoprotein YifL
VTKSVGAGAAILIVLFSLAGCGSSEPKEIPSTVTVVSTETTTAATTETTETDPTETTETSASAPPGATSATDEGSFTMPNLVGEVLQTAQNEMQRISGNPVYYTSSSDATGKGRRQILDRRWKVCSQSVAPGTQVPVHGPTIDFSVVKLDETCP